MDKLDKCNREREEARESIPRGIIAELYRELDRLYPGLYYNIVFDHVDAAGYFFKFKLRTSAEDQHIRI